jgi:hypothetical protein
VSEQEIDLEWGDWEPPKMKEPYQQLSSQVLSDDNATVAKVQFTWWLNDESIALEATGSSRRERGDARDRELGDVLATARALESLAAKLHRRARGLINDAENRKKTKPYVAREFEEVYDEIVAQGSGTPAPLWTLFGNSLVSTVDDITEAYRKFVRDYSADQVMEAHADGIDIDWDTNEIKPIEEPEPAVVKLVSGQTVRVGHDGKIQVFSSQGFLISELNI